MCGGEPVEFLAALSEAAPKPAARRKCVHGVNSLEAAVTGRGPRILKDLESLEAVRGSLHECPGQGAAEDEPAADMQQVRAGREIDCNPGDAQNDRRTEVGLEHD